LVFTNISHDTLSEIDRTPKLFPVQSHGRTDGRIVSFISIRTVLFQSLQVTAFLPERGYPFTSITRNRRG